MFSGLFSTPSKSSETTTESNLVAEVLGSESHSDSHSDEQVLSKKETPTQVSIQPSNQSLTSTTPSSTESVLPTSSNLIPKATTLVDMIDQEKTLQDSETFEEINEELANMNKKMKSFEKEKLDQQNQYQELNNKFDLLFTMFNSLTASLNNNNSNNPSILESNNDESYILSSHVTHDTNNINNNIQQQEDMKIKKDNKKPFHESLTSPFYTPYRSSKINENMSPPPKIPQYYSSNNNNNQQTKDLKVTKGLNLPTYKKGDDYLTWLKKFEAQALRHKWNEDTKILNFYHYLNTSNFPQVDDWSQNAQSGLGDYYNFELIKSLVGPLVDPNSMKTTLDYKKELVNIVMKDEETIIPYYTRFRAILMKVEGSDLNLNNTENTRN